MVALLTFLGRLHKTVLFVYSILKLRLDEKKVKGLKVFNSQPAINDVIVAEDVCKLIKKQRLDLGLDFMPIQKKSANPFFCSTNTNFERFLCIFLHFVVSLP